jgi:hypothetical protein
MKTLIYLCLVIVGSSGLSQSACANWRHEQVPYVPAESAYISNVRDSLVRMVQMALEDRGYYVGLNTGEFVFETRRAIRRYRADHGLPVVGKIDDELLASLGFR